MSTEHVEILTSGVALGVHVPGVLLARRLRERGLSAQTRTIESLWKPEGRRRLAENRELLRADFALARAAHRAVRDPADQIDPLVLRDLLCRWEAMAVNRLVVLSGFWGPVLAEYSRLQGSEPIRLDLCHVDAVRSPSFRHCVPERLEWGGGTHIEERWLADAEAGRLPWTIDVLPEPPLNWDLRTNRFLTHGGGWGMGTHQEAAAELQEHGFAVDRIVYRHSDLTAGTGRHRSFLLDPAWAPWDHCGFPPLKAATTGGVERDPRCHDSFHLTRRSRAVVSKPGGATLLDCLSAATPLLMLQPLAHHERRNADLWRALGLGIEYQSWADRGRRSADLKAMHQRLLLARAHVPDYTSAIARDAG